MKLPFTHSKSGLKIYLYYGPKGSGKSLFQIYIATQLFKEYYKIEKKYPQLPKRKYYSSQKFSKELEDKELGNHLEYWSNPRQLYHLRNCDIGWDEIGKDLPAGSWADTPKDLKQVFSHLRKRGNRIFANTQIYDDIDISFRRQIDKAYQVTKLFGSGDISASLPAPRFIWGLIKIAEFDPLDMESLNPKFRFSISAFPEFIWLTKKLVSMYDTTMELPPYLPDKLDHRELHCIDPDCDFVREVHRAI